MRTNTLRLFVCLSLAIGSMNACSDPDDDSTGVPNNPGGGGGTDCKVKSISLNDTLRQTLEYNSSGKLSKVFNLNANGSTASTINYVYSGSTVLEITSVGANHDTTFYTMGANGFASRMITSFGDTTLYEYDANGYVIKETQRYSVSTNTIVNGNETQSQTKDRTTGEIHYTTVTEYSTKPNAIAFGDASGLTGKGSKNLPTKEITTYANPTEVQTTTYSYPSFDANGNPTKINLSISTDGVVSYALSLGFGWICK